MLVALLLAGALAQGAAAAGPPPDGDVAAKLAGASYAFGCVQRLSAVASAAEYAAGAEDLAKGLKAQAPDITTAGIAGVDGRTCRVFYRGPNADTLWRAFTDFHIDKQNSPCTEAPATATKAALSCAATAENPAYDLLVTRAGDAVIADTTFRAPRNAK